MNRLNVQLQSQKNDYELMFKQKLELEKIIKELKQELLDSEKSVQDHYNQLISTKENFQILHNEQKLLSEELTQKQQELTNLERDKLN